MAANSGEKGERMVSPDEIRAGHSEAKLITDFEEASGSLCGECFAVMDDFFTAAENAFDDAAGFVSVEGRIAGKRLKLSFVDGVGFVANDDDIGVESRSDGAFVRPQTVDLCRISAEQAADLFPGDIGQGGEHGQEGFESGQTAGSGQRIGSFFIARVGAVVGDDHVDIVGEDGLSESVEGEFVAQGRLQDESPGFVAAEVVFIAQEEVLRACFVEDADAFGASLRDDVGGLFGGIVGDDDAGAGVVGEPDDAFSGFDFGDGGAQPGIVAPQVFAGDSGSFVGDDGVVFTVDEDGQTGFCCAFENPDDGLVIEVVVGAVGGVDFERRDAPARAFVNGIETLFGVVEHGHVEGIIDDAVFCLFEAEIEGVAEVFSGLRSDEVDDGRDAAARGFLAAVPPAVVGLEYAGVELNMAVSVDDSGQNDSSGAVDDFVVFCESKGFVVAKCSNDAVIDEDIGILADSVGDDGTIDETLSLHCDSPWDACFGRAYLRLRRKYGLLARLCARHIRLANFV